MRRSDWRLVENVVCIGLFKLGQDVGILPGTQEDVVWLEDLTWLQVHVGVVHAMKPGQGGSYLRNELPNLNF